MRLFTIGFTKSTAEGFFERLREAGVTVLIDVRLNNVSQLAGFAKRDDLRYFLRVICGADYVHEPRFAPTQSILDAYRDKSIGWEEYEKQFIALLQERDAQKVWELIGRDGACLLCSEDKPDKCHRRLVAEYVASRVPGIRIIHL